MSSTPGISPLTPDIEEIRHSEDDPFGDTQAPDETVDPMKESEDAGRDDAERTRQPADGRT